MPIEWDFLRGPLDSIRDDLVDVLMEYGRYKQGLRVGITSNPILSFVGHADVEGREPHEYVSERMVCIYETRSLDEAIDARDLLLAHAREKLPSLSARADNRNEVREESDDVSYFVYLLGDSIYELPVRKPAVTT